MQVESYYGGEIKFVKTDNLRAFKIVGQFSHYLSESGNALIANSELQENDLIITIIGATHDIVGRAAMVSKADLPANINQNIALIRLSDKYSPEVLSAYLNSDIGKLAFWHLARQTGQVNLNCREVERVLVPRVSEHLVQCIENAYQTASTYQQEARNVFAETEEILTELGLADWQPQRRAESVRSFSEVWSAGRLDAEYYQPKYDEVVNAVKGYRGGWDTLSNLVNLKGVNFQPDGATEYRYIELANIASDGEIMDCTVGLGADLPSRARRKVSAGDVIVSSIEGSLDSIALIDGQYDDALCSTGFHVVNPRAFNTETLLVLLKSTIGQLQLKKGCSGTILTAINKDEFSKIVLPKISDGTQTEIQQKVAESVALRSQSRRLLEAAKRAVEIAIEQDEPTAIAWLGAQKEEMP